MKVGALFRFERQQNRNNRVPRVGAPGHEQVPADVARHSVVEGATRGNLLAVQGRVRCDRRAVEDERVLREAGDYEIDVHLRHLLRCHGRTRLQEHFQPHAEATGVEPLVGARHGRSPQVEIEDARQLLGCRQRHELRAVLEPDALNDAMQQLGLKARNRLCEVWRVQNAFEKRPFTGISPRRTVVWPARPAAARYAGIEGVRTTSTTNRL